MLRVLGSGIFGVRFVDSGLRAQGKELTSDKPAGSGTLSPTLFTVGV